MGCISTKIEDFISYKEVGNRSNYTAGDSHAAENDERMWAAQLMQQCMDNGLNIGGDFEKWFEIIAVPNDSYNGEQVFADDGWWGNNKKDAEGKFMGEEEFTALCMVMSDLADMRDDGRMTIEEYEAKMTELFQPETMHALMVGDKGDAAEREPFLAIARDVSNMHGDDMDSADVRVADDNIKAANKAIMQVERRPVINEIKDYAYTRCNEEATANNLTYSLTPGENFESDFNDIDNIISQWAADGKLPEGMTREKASARILAAKGEIEAYDYSKVGACSLAYAFRDIDAIEDPAVKADYIASLFNENVIEDIAYGNNAQNDCFGPGIRFLQDLDLVRLDPAYVSEAYKTDPAVDDDVYEDQGDGKGDDPQKEDEGADTGYGETAIADIGDMTVLLRQDPSRRMEILKDAAIEYFNGGSSSDIAESFADRDFTQEEIEQIQTLAMFGPAYLENASAKDIFAITNPNEDLAEASKAHTQAQFDAAANIMTWDDPNAFIKECEAAGYDSGLAAILYDRAADHFKAIETSHGNTYDLYKQGMDVESEEVKTSLLKDASENAADYKAEVSGQKDGDGDEVHAQAEQAREEMIEEGTSYSL